MDSGTFGPLRLRWVRGVCMFSCNLPPALLAEWLGPFTCHCSNTGVEGTLNKSQHTKFTLKKKIFPLLLQLVFWTGNLSITSPTLYQQQAILVLLHEERWKIALNCEIVVAEGPWQEKDLLPSCLALNVVTMLVRTSYHKKIMQVYHDWKTKQQNIQRL